MSKRGKNNVLAESQCQDIRRSKLKRSKIGELNDKGQRKRQSKRITTVKYRILSSSCCPIAKRGGFVVSFLGSQDYF